MNLNSLNSQRRNPIGVLPPMRPRPHYVYLTTLTPHLSSTVQPSLCATVLDLFVCHCHNFKVSASPHSLILCISIPTYHNNPSVSSSLATAWLCPLSSLCSASLSSTLHFHPFSISLCNYAASATLPQPFCHSFDVAIKICAYTF